MRTHNTLHETVVPAGTIEAVLEASPTLETLDRLTTQRQEIEGVVSFHLNIDAFRSEVDQALDNIIN